jgi:hypothetical protein
MPNASPTEKPRRPWPIDLTPSTTGPLKVVPANPERDAYLITDDLGVVAYCTPVHDERTGYYDRLASFREAQALCLTLQAQRARRAA